MGAACCRCVQPASVQPRKTYNTLVSQLFVGEPIKTDDPIDSTMRRKIQKLQEYLQANPAKVPKASRRLMRRIQGTLRKPGDNLGHVKVAVHTYAYLLATTADERSSYGPTFFLKELLTGPDAVVPLLLRDIHIEMRTLGAELLAVFACVQSPVDSKLDAIQAHVTQVCRVARGALESDRKEQKLQETNQRRRAGDKLAVPDPIYLIGRRDPAHVAALEVACLRCLKEVVVLCRKNKMVPAQLAEIQAVMLDNLQAGREVAGSSSSAVGATTTSPDQQATAAAAALPDTSVVDNTFYSAMGVQQHVPHGSQRRELAEQLLQQMASFIQDIAMVDKILDSFYQYMDKQHHWQEQRVVKNFLAALGSSGGQHHYIIFASLLRHAVSRDLVAADCCAVLRVAKEQGERLDEAYSLSALQLALAELPRAWAEQAQRDPKFMAHLKPFLDLLRAGTAALKDLAHLPAESSSPGQQPGAGTPSSAAAPPIPGAQQSADTAGAAGEGGGVLQQQLAALKLVMLETVQALAARVQTAAELCEVITGVLTVVGAGLHLGGHSTPHTPSAATGPVMNGPAQAAASPFQALAAGGPGSAKDRQYFVGAGDPAKLATAGLALDLAAAAAESRMQQQQFVTPLNSFSGAANGIGHGEPALMLPGGVLPPQLLSTALPMLRHGPPAIRQAVQRILVTLQPGAPQGVPSASHAKQLAEAALQEVRQAQALAAADEEAAHDGFVPASVAGADALLRCSLRGQQPWPTAVLSISRALLQLQTKWAQHGYCTGTGGSPLQAHGLVLFFNSQLAALADATNHRQLLAHQLPLDAHSHPLLQLTQKGLVLTGAAGVTGPSDAVLQALQQQHKPTPQHVEGLRAALLQVPVLVAAHGDQLPSLLDPQRGPRVSSAGGNSDKPQLAKVNAVLTKTLSTQHRDLVHVSDLLKRESVAQPLPSITAVVDEGAVQPPAAASTSVDRAADTAQTSAAAAAAASSGVGSAIAGPEQARGVQSAAVAADDVHVAVSQPAAPLSGQSSDVSLSAAVAAVLRQPVPATASTPAVRDIKISRLAGELDSQL